MTDPFVRARTAAMHHRLERELDALTGDGVLLDPHALRRLRAVVDEAVPVADAYAAELAELGELGDSGDAVA